MTRRPNAGAGGGCYLFSFEVGMHQGSVTLPSKSLRGVRAPNRFTCFHMHKVPNGRLAYILRTGSSQRNGRGLYSFTTFVPFIQVFVVGRQLHAAK